MVVRSAQLGNNCVLCASSATHKKRDWQRDDIRSAYSRMAGKQFAPEIPIIDYEIIECESCGLLFALPQTPGNDLFYQWVTTSVRNYYQEHRWEWGRVVEILSDHPRKNILEIGCGSGNFLQYISKRLELRATGLDTHPAAIAACKTRGLPAYCLSLEEFALEHNSSKFDLICAFHCLEHVSDPMAFVRTMRALLTSDGSIIMSVPYSPTSLEVLEWDCLNLPPHHLTRWNKTCLVCLGDSLGMSVEVQSDESDLPAVFDKKLWWKFLDLTGGARDSLRGFSRTFSHPIALARLISFILSRDRISGKRAGNTALAIFRCQ